MYQYIEIFNNQISTYAIMVLIGIFTCGILISKTIKNKDEFNIILELSLFSLLGAFIFSHLLYFIVNYELFIRFITNFDKIDSFSMFINSLGILFGGSVFYGGLLGAILTGFIYCKKKKINFLNYANIIAPFIPLFHFFGRIGCFLGGCCYGIESKIGLRYPVYMNGVLEYKRLFPVQLVEAGLNIVLFVILYKLYKKGKNNLLMIYLICYSIIRFILEFFRGDEARGFVLGLSTSQFISVIILICCMIILIRKKTIKKAP